MVEVATNTPFSVEIIEQDLWIPLGSGHRLAGRLWLPDNARVSPVPALLEFLPYRKSDLTRGRDEPIHHYFASFGYASIRVDMRGSGDSFGVMRDEYELQEQDDALEVIAWLAEQPWCNGRVGMFGISWGGFNALQVAARRAPALRAIISSCSTDDRYSDDMHYMGGCLLNDNLDWGTTFFSLLPLPGDPRVMGEGWRANWDERLGCLEPPVARWMGHQTRDDYWKHGSINEDYSAIACPVFLVGGWLDGYSNAIPRMLEHLTVPSIGVIGPHAHQFGFEDRAPGPAYGFLQEACRWWDHWLKDVPTGILDEPKLRAFMGDNIPATSWYPECPGRWVGENSWPSPRIDRQRLHLNASGLGTERGHDVPLTLTPRQTVGIAAGEWCPYGTGGIGPEFPDDQRVDDVYSLTFDSPPLPDRLEILGAPFVELDLAVDKPCAFVAVRLNDVKPDSTVTRTSFGILNLTHRDGSDSPKPLEPGRRYRVRVVLNDAAYSFGQGHRIRVSISSSYWPMVWPSPEPVTLTLYAGNSALELPVRPIESTESGLRPLPPPVSGPPMRRAQINASPSSYRTIYDQVTRRLEICTERGTGVFRIEENGIETGRNVIERMAITVDDPLSAVSLVKVHTRTGRTGWIVDVRVESTLTASKSEFLLESKLEIEENHASVQSRTWQHRFPRNLI